jgi:DNA-binding LytR/AlgR family response regulator
VFVSAYDSAAVDAFELRAVDYLRKPVSRRRVEEALDRVTTTAAEPPAGNGAQRQGSESDVIAVANIRGGGTRLLARSDILYAQAHGDYARIVTADGRYLLRATITELKERWEPFGFARVHRQFVANLHRAIEVRPLLGGTAELAFAGDLTIPIARRHVAELKRRLRA